jgi:ubiquitin-conjugating enzyme E2 J1
VSRGYRIRRPVLLRFSSLPHPLPRRLCFANKNRHFTIRGADGTDFEGGTYHGRILLPPEYPYKPPHIVFLTPSGRFETGTKVCLSFSAFHPELWQPAWGIRLILEALISFLPTPADGAIGALDWSPAERRRLAARSASYECPRCGRAAALLPRKKDEGGGGGGKPPASASASAPGKPSRFEKEIEQLMMLQRNQHGPKDEEANRGGVDGSHEAANESAAAGEARAVPPQEQPRLPPAAATPSGIPLGVVVVVGGGEGSAADAPSSEGPSPRVGGRPAEPGEAEGAPRPPTVPGAPEAPPAPPLERLGAAREALPPPGAASAGAAGGAGLGDAGEGDGGRQTRGDGDELDGGGDDKSPALWDPALQILVVVLSAVCYLLARKVGEAYRDLQALEALDAAE